jgi:hypothetical protein
VWSDACRLGAWPQFARAPIVFVFLLITGAITDSLLFQYQRPLDGRAGSSVLVVPGNLSDTENVTREQVKASWSGIMVTRDITYIIRERSGFIGWELKSVRYHRCAAMRLCGMPVVVPMWLLVGWLLFVTLLVSSLLMRSRVVPTPFCMECGYDCHGLSHCPECGSGARCNVSKSP